MQRRAINTAIGRGGGRCSSTARRRADNRYPISISLANSLHHHTCTVPSSLQWSRLFATTVDNNNNQEDEVIIPNSNPIDSQSSQNQPIYTTQQLNLLQYTTQILPTNLQKYPPGTLEYIQLLQLSNCITQWIDNSVQYVDRGFDSSSSEIGSLEDTTISKEQKQQRYLGAEQAVKLLKRLIIERGGGRSLLRPNVHTDDTIDNNGDDLSSIHTKVRPNPGKSALVLFCDMIRVFSIKS